MGQADFASGARYSGFSATTGLLRECSTQLKKNALTGHMKDVEKVSTSLSTGSMTTSSRTGFSFPTPHLNISRLLANSSMFAPET